MMRRIGFTGTQVEGTHGLTTDQQSNLYNLLAIFDREHQDVEMRHGDCVGADAIAHRLALELGWKIVIHPPTDSRRRAFCNGKGVTVRPRKHFIERNHDIVDACDVLVACPNTEKPKLRSGTWATVRFALKRFKQVFIVLPSGRIWQPESTWEVEGRYHDEGV